MSKNRNYFNQNLIISRFLPFEIFKNAQERKNQQFCCYFLNKDFKFRRKENDLFLKEDKGFIDHY